MANELMLVEGGQRCFADMSLRTDALERTIDFLLHNLLGIPSDRSEQ